MPSIYFGGISSLTYYATERIEAFYFLGSQLMSSGNSRGGRHVRFEDETIGTGAENDYQTGGTSATHRTTLPKQTFFHVLRPVLVTRDYRSIRRVGRGPTGWSLRTT